MISPLAFGLGRCIEVDFIPNCKVEQWDEEWTENDTFSDDEGQFSVELSRPEEIVSVTVVFCPFNRKLMKFD